MPSLTLVVILMAQANLLDIPFDLRAAIPTSPCAATGAEEIIVCARPADDATYRLPLPVPPPAGTNTGVKLRLFDGVESRVHVDRRDILGVPDNQLKMTFKIPF